MMAGMRVVVVACDARAATSTSPTCVRSQSRSASPTDLAALMVTYPSTHGVFEDRDPRGLRRRSTRTAARCIFDGANLNAHGGSCAAPLTTVPTSVT